MKNRPLAPVLVVHPPTEAELARRAAVFAAFLVANPTDPYTGLPWDVPAERGR